MSEKRQLGSILLESGRITQADVERVLEHQRTNGGFFGQALVALEIVTRDEIDWALASQFDLPYIFPNPDSVDRDAAMLVAADWALAHLAVPIVRAGDTITVVVADPMQKQAFDDLRSRTGFEVELALASPTRIRELIRALYGDTEQPAEEERTPISLVEFFATALDQHPDALGISVRGPVAWAWYERDAVHRRALNDGWEDALSEIVRPSPGEQMDSTVEGLVSWTATLNRGGSFMPVDAQALVGAGGVEYLFRPLTAGAASRSMSRSMALPTGIVAELRLLARSGKAVVALASKDPELARAVLPYLPSLVRQEVVRAVHICADRESMPRVYTIHPRPGDEMFDSLESYRFDSVTVDLSADDYPVGQILQAAPLSFAYLREPDWQRRLPELGIKWILSADREERGGIAWELRAVNA
jgi:type IV pilus assembly protein PilB